MACRKIEDAIALLAGLLTTREAGSVRQDEAFDGVVLACREYTLREGKVFVVAIEQEQELQR
jgi:hypothetical protein